MAFSRCLWASRPASSLRLSAFRRAFSSDAPCFGPPASRTIDEHTIKEEMRLLFPEHLEPKKKPSTGGDKDICIIETCKHQLHDGRWIIGSNLYKADNEEDRHNNDKRRLMGGFRYLVEEKGTREIGRFGMGFEGN